MYSSLLFDLLDYLWDKWEYKRKYKKADESERSILKYVPKYCQYCELLGICRDESNNWKCKHGCLILNEERKN